MIIEPSLTELSKIIPDRYELILTIAKRAKELQGGSDKLTRFEHPNYLAVAAHEIKEGLVRPTEKKEGLY